MGWKEDLLRNIEGSIQKETDENKPHYFVVCLYVNVKPRFTSITVQTDTNNAMADPVLGHMVVQQSPENVYNTELQKNLAPDI